MTEIFDFFAKHYPSIIPMLTGAFVSFFIVWFYLKISNQMTDLGKKMVRLDEKMDDRFAKVYEQFLEFRKEMNERFLEHRKEMNERFLELRKEMNERFAKSDEQFLEHRKEMNERSAKSDERFLELRKEMNERSAKSDERFVKSDERFLEFSKEMNDRFMYLIEKIHPMPLRP